MTQINKTNQINQIDQMNQINQKDQTNQINERSQRLLPLRSSLFLERGGRYFSVAGAVRAWCGRRVRST